MLQRLCDYFDSLWEKSKGWRTVIFGVLLTSSGIALQILEMFQNVDLSFLFSPRSAVVANIVIGILVIWLRFVTTGPVGKKDE